MMKAQSKAKTYVLPPQAFVDAIEDGDVEKVKSLIPFSGIKQRTNALALAAQCGHVDIVKALIPVSSPKARSSNILYYAHLNQETEIVALLIPVSDVDTVALRFFEKGNLELVEQLSHHISPGTIQVLVGGFENREERLRRMPSLYARYWGEKMNETLTLISSMPAGKRLRRL